jgi:hypothetical protein
MSMTPTKGNIDYKGTPEYDDMASFLDAKHTTLWLNWDVTTTESRHNAINWFLNERASFDQHRATR